MDYNQELLKLEEEKNRLINKAKLEGYVVVNEKLIMKDFVPVIEFYMNVKTLYESTGHYLVVKGTVVIENSDFQAFKELEGEEEILEYLIESCREYSGLSPLYDAFEYLGNYHLHDIFFEVCEQEALEHYWRLEEDPELFGKEINMKREEGEGYISIYRMSIKDFIKKEEENINIKLTKYLRYN